jgi:hypothetical protein
VKTTGRFALSSVLSLSASPGERRPGVFSSPPRSERERPGEGKRARRKTLTKWVDRAGVFE